MYEHIFWAAFWGCIAAKLAYIVFIIILGGFVRLARILKDRKDGW